MEATPDTLRSSARPSPTARTHKTPRSQRAGRHHPTRPTSSFWISSPAPLGAPKDWMVSLSTERVAVALSCCGGRGGRGRAGGSYVLGGGLQWSGDEARGAAAGRADAP